MSLLLSDVTHLIEVRSNADDWHSTFRAEVPWSRSDGVIGEPYDAAGLWSFFEVDQVADAVPVVNERSWESTCPFVGPRRGFFGYWFDRSHIDTARFYTDVVRAGRGFVVDLGPLDRRAAVPRVRASVEFGVVPIVMRRIPCIDIELALKHNNSALLSNEPTYVKHVQEQLDRLARRKGAGAHRETEEIEIWRYESSLW